MKATVFYFILFSLFVVSGYAQQQASFDTIKPLEEVVVTSTKTANSLSNIAVPFAIISKSTITQAGTLRLKDILQEQAGIFITNGFGAGIQMQGLNPDYTLILLNGEPLVGRTAGVLDANRINISNIKKIEIVKGPSSSLYGSEAMAGVINIITNDINKKETSFGVRYGFGNPDKGWVFPTQSSAFKNIDLNFSISRKFKNTSIQFSSNAYYIDGVSFRPYTTKRIPQPIWRLSQLLQLHHQFNDKLTFQCTFRNGYDYIKQDFEVANNGSISKTTGREANLDYNFNPSIGYQIRQHIKNTTKLYATIYDGSQKLYFNDAKDSSYIDIFKQHFYRIENQTDFQLGNNRLSVGGGYSIDEAKSTRYDYVENTKRNRILYGYLQTEWLYKKKWIVIAGVRYDYNSLFAAALSPKLAVRYNASKKIAFTASIGRGFKAPDFRQLYLNFTNNAAGGYSVFGAIDAINIINQMQVLGQISEIKADFSKLTALTPEFSTGINMGANIQLHKNISTTINVFRNDINGLIDARHVATKTNGAQIYSYINIKKAYTQGGELSINWKLNPSLSLSMGYQYLQTADKDDLTNIRNGNVYTRNADGTSRLLQKAEYIGLANRSKHMGNVKITYEKLNGLYATMRLNYRSSWYVADSDGNGVYNTHDEHANGFVLANCSMGKKWKNGVTVFGGMDNIINYRDANYLPNVQGRMIYTGINFNIQ